MKKTLLLILITIALSCELGYSQTKRVQVGDLYYNLSGMTASVAPSDEITKWGAGPSKYTKEVYLIPPHITYDGLEYEVIGIDKWAFSGYRRDMNGYLTIQGAIGSPAKMIILPPTIKRIGEAAFANCTNLTQMVIPPNVESLGEGSSDTYCSFYNTPLLRELIYLSSFAPQGWHATSKTYVPNPEYYIEPSTSVPDASILPIASTNGPWFKYSGKMPTLTMSNNLQNYNFESNIPSLKKNVGEYELTIEAQISNEDISYAFTIPFYYEIYPAEIIVSVSNYSKEYGELNPEFEINYDGLVNNETIDVIKTKAYATVYAGRKSSVGKYPINVSGAEAHNYEFKYLPGELTITKANLELSVENVSKIYGSVNPNFILSYSGLKNNESTPQWNELPTISTSAEQNSDVGNYTISVDGGDAKNYLITKYNSGILTIDKANQELTWDQNLNVKVHSHITLEATSSAGLPASYEMSPNNIANLYNNNGTWYLDCYGCGAVEIRAVQNGDKNHNAAITLTKTLVVIDTGTSQQININVEKAGTLSSLIAENRKYQIKNLCLTGYLNGNDIKFLREMAGSDIDGNSTAGVLETLDISNCIIISGGSRYYKSFGTSNYEVSNYMFYNCKQLINLLLPENTTRIKDFAFADCDKLSVIAIPDRVVCFGEQSFRNDVSLTRIPMPNNLTSIYDYAFMGCNGLSEITIPKGVNYIGDGIVKNCQNMVKINVVTGNNRFISKNGVLYTSTLDKLLIFPNSSDFNNYSVIDGTNKIAPYAFYNSRNLNELFLPSSLSSIGNDAFIGCTNLSNIKITATTPPICDNDCFDSTSKTRCELTVPQGCYNYYWVAPVWSDFIKLRESDYSSVDEVSNNEINITIENSNIVIKRVPADLLVYIFQVDGTILHKVKSYGEDIVYQTNGAGMYFVNINDKTYKLMVK